MCIICVKDNEAPDFTTEILKYCWDKNPDGAGYAVWRMSKGMWEVKKGFMKWDDFIKNYRAENFKDDTVFVHFRIGTSGAKDGGNTHPFPVLDDVEAMRKTHFFAENIAIHNGVVGAGEKLASDTIVYIRDYLFPLMAIWEDDRVSSKIADSILTKGTSRWIVTNKEKWWKYGTWHTHKKWEFSNLNYESSVYYYRGGGTVYNSVYSSDPKPCVFDTHKDEWYDKLQGINAMPYGYYTSGWHEGSAGYWQSGKFETWKALYERRRALPQPYNETNQRSAFYKKYFHTYITKGGRSLSVMNWHLFIKEEEKSSAIIEAIIDDVDVVVTDKEDEQKFNKDLDELKLCPSCFGDKLKESDFNVGDTQCETCGCVFTSLTGVVYTYDLDTYRKYSKGRS